MESRHLNRLQEEQQKAITETENRIQQCEKFKSDYKALQDRLKTLPDSVTHDIMVPFGRLGFMPGQLVHTNEVLVLLGDNWFAERSAKQAVDITDRRIKELDKQIKDLEDQMRLLAPRLGFTSELQSELEGSKDVKEIVEEYDEEKEKQWDEQHRKNVKRYKEQLRQNEAKEEHTTTKSKSKADSSKVPTDVELWSRLDELERQEEEQGDLDSSEEDSDDDKPDADSEPDPKSQVRWADEGSTNGSTNGSNDGGNDDDDEETESDDEAEEDEDEESRRPVRKIVFSHSKAVPEVPAIVELSDPTSITSPADIYKLFTPKPILKKKSEQEGKSDKPKVRLTSPKDDSDPGLSYGAGDAKVSTIQSSAQQAFSGKIVERSVASQEVKSQTVPKYEPTKRVSRFKAQRMQQSS